MRRSTSAFFSAATVLVVALASLTAAAQPAAEEEARLPPPLADLLLNVGHPTITPVAFPHAQHLDPAVQGREVSCAHCHHELADAPDAIPRPCTDCHQYTHESPTPTHGEDEPHDHSGPPDL